MHNLGIVNYFQDRTNLLFIEAADPASRALGTIRMEGDTIQCASHTDSCIVPNDKSILRALEVYKVLKLETSLSGKQVLIQATGKPYKHRRAIVYFNDEDLITDIEAYSKESLEEKMTKFNGETFSEYWDKNRTKYHSIS